MSLIIFPQAFEAGLNPKASPTVFPLKEVPLGLEGDTHSTNADMQVDLSHLKTIKIIPEEETYGGTNFSSNRSFVNNKTTFSINSNSDELVEKIIDPETGEDIWKTPDISQQQLNQHINEYQKLAFEEFR